MTVQKISSRLPEMSWIRGIAALIVGLFHYTTIYAMFYQPAWTFRIANGASAVSVFFLLSGFLTVLALKDTDRVGSYLWKRAKRLYPSYWVCILVTSAVMYLFLPERAPDAKTIAVNFTMLQTMLGYANVDEAYWTLRFELRFYLFVALVLLLRQQKNMKWYTLLWTIVSLVLYHLFIRMEITRRLVRLPAIWLMADSCAPFAIGVFLACLKRKLTDVVAWIGLGLSVYLAFYSQPPTHLTAQLTAGGVILAAVVLRSLPGTGERFRAAVDRLDRGPLRVLSWFASISYPFYLLHAFVGWAILQTIEKAGFHSQWIIVFPFVICTFLAWLIHRFVEQRVR